MSTIITEFCELKQWKKGLNEIQSYCVDHGLLTSTENLVVIAPTSTGKTGIAELAIYQELKNGLNACYLVPSLALINSKRAEFTYLDKDFQVYPKEGLKYEEANLAIDTFETFYRRTLKKPELLRRFSLIIVDEFHFLYDKLRGYNLEKVITLIKESSARVICLSATFEDKQKISRWLNANLVIIPEDRRQVKLNNITLNYTGLKDKNPALYRKLETDKTFPTIIFCSRTDWSESRANSFSSLVPNPVNDIKQITSKFEEELERTNFTSQENKLLNCVLNGIGFHHAQISEPLKEVVETYFVEGKIKYLFSTTTLAYGMNFPAKSVVIYDLDWPGQENKSVPYPVYTYIQMAGRAGRGQQFANEGFVYTIALEDNDLKVRIPKYNSGKLEEATSNIINDDFFRKTILELIYAERVTYKDFISFFEKTYFNYLSLDNNPFTKFDLITSIKPHVEYLVNNNFILPQGSSGYKLTDLGEVVIDFLFKTFHPYELDLFLKLNINLERNKVLKADFDLLYKFFLLFENIRCKKIGGRVKVPEIERYFKLHYNPTITCDDPEYTAYAVYYGWMENIDEYLLEERYKINPSRLEINMKELSNLLVVYQKLAEKKGYEIPVEYELLKKRIYYGVSEEEFHFRTKKGLGRETCKNIKSYCRNTLETQPYNFKDGMLSELYQLYLTMDESKFYNILMQITNIGPHKSNLIMEIIKLHDERMKKVS